MHWWLHQWAVCRELLLQVPCRWLWNQVNQRHIQQKRQAAQNGYQFASETFRIRLAQKTLKQQRRSARKPIPPKQKNLQKSSKNRARVTQSEGRMHQKCSQNWNKCGESPKVATRWLPRPLYREGLVDFFAIFGSLLGPKNYWKSNFS